MKLTTISAVLAITITVGPGAAHDGPHGNEAPERRGAQERPPMTPPAMKATELPPAEVTIAIEGKHRVIRSNGLPDHATGTFPNRDNPNALRPQRHVYRVPVDPVAGETPTSARPEFGIAVNGVIFDAGTGEFWSPGGRVFGGGSAWNYDALGGGVGLGLDSSNAHVQPTGKYHYHGIPRGLLERLGGDAGVKRPILVGWAADGFPIYGPYGHADAMDPASEVRALRSSYRLKSGTRPASPDGPGGSFDGTFSADWEYVEGAGDLDACNGRFGVTPEFPAGTYHYVITDAFPSVPRFWRGTPDASFRRPPPGAGGGGPGMRRSGPPRGNAPPRRTRSGLSDDPPLTR